jgi:acetylornithine/N-succinyldiaminopimelate aminotransferase
MINDFNLEELIRKDQEDSQIFKLPSDIICSKANGVKITDSSGNEYIDFSANNDENSIGYNHQSLIEAYEKANFSYPYTSNFFKSVHAAELTEKLKGITGLPFNYYSSSSLEARDTALKIIKTLVKYNFSELNRTDIITIGPRIDRLRLFQILDPAIEPFLPACHNFGLVTETTFTESLFKNILSKKTAAVIIDPMISVEGKFICEHSVFEVINKLCTKHDVVMIIDATHIAPGRTGKFLPYSTFLPDVLLLSAGVGQGIRLGVTAVSAEIETIIDLRYQHHYEYSELACQLALKGIDFLVEDSFKEMIQEKSNYLVDKLSGLQERHLNILDIQANGLYVTVELDFNLTALVHKCLEKKCIVNLLNQKTLKLTPPYNIEKEHIDQLIEVLDQALNELKPDDRLT